MRYLAITAAFLMSLSTFAYAGNSCEKVMKRVRDIVIEEFSFAEVTLELEPDTFCPQLKLTNGTDAADAIRDALYSFVNDDSDYESPLALIIPDAFDVLGIGYTHPIPEMVLEKAKELVHGYMSRNSTVIRFMSLDEEAEHGESIEHNWVVHMNITDYSDHRFFAVIDRTGEGKVYNYGFN